MESTASRTSIAWSALGSGENKRRQEAQDVSLHAVEHDAAIERVFDEGTTRDGQFDAEHQAFSADLDDLVELQCKGVEAFAQPLAGRTDAGEDRPRLP